MTRMPIRDSDLRQAVSESGIRPGDEAWSALTELQRRRDAEEGWSRTPSSDRGDDKRRRAADEGTDSE